MPFDDYGMPYIDNTHPPNPRTPKREVLEPYVYRAFLGGVDACNDHAMREMRQAAARQVGFNGDFDEDGRTAWAMAVAHLCYYTESYNEYRSLERRFVLREPDRPESKEDSDRCETYKRNIASAREELAKLMEGTCKLSETFKMQMKIQELRERVRSLYVASGLPSRLVDPDDAARATVDKESKVVSA